MSTAATGNVRGFEVFRIRLGQKPFSLGIWPATSRDEALDDCARSLGFKNYADRLIKSRASWRCSEVFQ